MKTIKVVTKEFLNNLITGASFVNKNKANSGDLKISFFMDNTFKIVSFDEENAISIKGQVLFCEEDTNIIVNSSEIINALKVIDDDVIEFLCEDVVLSIKYLKGHIKLPLWDANNYPSPVLGNKQGTFNVPTKFLCKSLANGLNFCEQSDTSRPVLNCIHFDITKTLVKVCATNALSLYYDSIEISNENEFKININYKVLNKLIQYSNDEEYTKINVYDNFIFVKYNDISILSRNIEGKYPNYSAVINNAITNKRQEIKIDINDLNKAIKRVNISSNINSVHFTNNANWDAVNINGYSNDAMSSVYKTQELLSCTFDNNIDFNIAFNLNTFKNGIKPLKGEVLFNYNNNQSALYITNQEDNSLILIMPVLKNDE